jgi:hypothetical protein
MKTSSQERTTVVTLLDCLGDDPGCEEVILQAVMFFRKSGWFILGFMRLIKVDNQPFIHLIKLLINLLSMHYLSRISGILGGVSYNSSLQGNDKTTAPLETTKPVQYAMDKERETAIIKVSDLTGRILYCGDAAMFNKNHIPSTGIYILTYFDENGTFIMTEKRVFQK